jgi:hypothetical protein
MPPRLASTLPTGTVRHVRTHHTSGTPPRPGTHPATLDVVRAHASDTFEASSTSGTQAPGAGATTPTRTRLAEAARRAALSMGGYHGHGKCATGVERAVASAMHEQVHGNGNSIGSSLLEHGFHQVSISLKDALTQPGLVLTWQHTPTRLGRKYGHVAVTLGDGHSSASDFVERDTVGGSVGRTGLVVYAPND